jgi:hypothetical protein
LPFISEHILCLRRWPVTSLAQGYTSVWHRNPEGLWTFIQDVSPNKACSRYFGSDVAKSLLREIEIVWLSPRDFIVSIDGDYNLNWQVSLGQTLSTSLINTTSRLIPNALYRNAVVLKLIARIGSLTLGAGRLSLTGKVPYGQRFISNPRYLGRSYPV